MTKKTISDINGWVFISVGFIVMAVSIFFYDTLKFFIAIGGFMTLYGLGKLSYDNLKAKIFPKDEEEVPVDLNKAQNPYIKKATQQRQQAQPQQHIPHRQPTMHQQQVQHPQQQQRLMHPQQSQQYTQPQRTQQRPTQHHVTQAKYCHNCGAPKQPHHRFCAHCGARVS